MSQGLLDCRPDLPPVKGKQTVRAKKYPAPRKKIGTVYIPNSTPKSTRLNNLHPVTAFTTQFSQLSTTPHLSSRTHVTIYSRRAQEVQQNTTPTSFTRVRKTRNDRQAEAWVKLIARKNIRCSNYQSQKVAILPPPHPILYSST